MIKHATTFDTSSGLDFNNNMIDASDVKMQLGKSLSEVGKKKRKKFMKNLILFPFKILGFFKITLSFNRYEILKMSSKCRNLNIERF